MAGTTVYIFLDGFGESGCQVFRCISLELVTRPSFKQVARGRNDVAYHKKAIFSCSKAFKPPVRLRRSFAMLQLEEVLMSGEMSVAICLPCLLFAPRLQQVQQQVEGKCKRG